MSDATSEATSDDAPRDSGPSGELLIAVVLNGGVSLAVWMGGATLELNRLTRARPVPLPDPVAATPVADPYAVVLGLAGTEARVDVVAGSSAGGINGAALAIAQANPSADLAGLRSLWTDQGRMEELLRQPYREQPTSLLRGQYFQDQLRWAMSALATNFPPGDPPASGASDPLAPRRIPPEVVLLTTTLLTSTRTVTVDDVGQQLPDISQGGLFRFTKDDFTHDKVDVTAEALAQAARASASFPFAFEPAFVPVNEDVAGLRDMAPWAEWSQEGDRTKRSRYAVDGGVLANTPTPAALRAIERLGSAAPSARRVMVLLYPHAPGVPDETSASSAKPPTVLEMVNGVTRAMTSQGSRTFVSEVDRHNNDAGSWRAGRSDILTNVGDIPDAAAQLWTAYRRLRLTQVANAWAERAPVPRPDTVTTAQIRGGVVDAFRAFETPERPLPFVPRQWAEGATVSGTAPWPWGVDTALSLLDALSQLLVEAGRLAAQQQVHAQREVVLALDTELRGALFGSRTDDDWTTRLETYASWLAEGNGAKIRDCVHRAATQLVEAAKTAVPREWAALVTPSCSAGDVTRRLLALEVVTAVITGVDPPVSTVPIGLVQVGMGTQHPFAQVSRTGDDKLAGLSLGHFGGFLKRSWRVNDWIWGRLDAATMLARTVLTGPRLVDVLNAHRDLDAKGLLTLLFGTAEPALPGVDELREAADAELKALRAMSSTQVRERDVDGLVRLCAWALHIQIILEELPQLESAIRADEIEGASKRSRGQIFLAEWEGLLADVRKGQGDAVRLGVQALTAFDRAGIGREELSDEGTSDQMIRTAVTAAAVGATVLDSDNFGPTAVKVVSKVVRGLTLLPFWVTVGLTSGNRIARGLGLFALTAGGVLLTLSLLVPLPGNAATWGPLLGGGALLFGLAFAALRSGSLVHSLVLAAPIIPMLVVAGHRWYESEEAGTSDGGLGPYALFLGLALAAVLAALASLPNPVISVAATAGLVGRWFRRGDDEDQDEWLRRMLWPFAMLLVIAACGLVGVVATVTVTRGVASLPSVPATVRTLAVVDAVAFAVGWVVAWRAGRWLKVYVEKHASSSTGTPPPRRTWDLRNVTHPAGVSAGWAVVYGALYVVLGGLGLLLFRGARKPAADAAQALDAARSAAARGTPGDPTLAAQVMAKAAAARSAQDLVVAWGGMAIGLCLLALVIFVVGPVAAPARARRMIRHVLVAEGRADLDRTLRAGRATDAPTALVDVMEKRGWTYYYLVEPQDGRLTLEAAAQEMAADIEHRRRRGSAVPMSVHLAGAATAVIVLMVVGLVVWMRPGPSVLPWWLAVAAVVGAVVGASLLGVLLGRVEGRRLAARETEAVRLPGGGVAVAGAVLAVVAGLLTSWLVPVPDPARAWCGAAVALAATAAQVTTAAVVRRRAVRRRGIGALDREGSPAPSPDPSQVAVQPGG